MGDGAPRGRRARPHGGARDRGLRPHALQARGRGQHAGRSGEGVGRAAFFSLPRLLFLLPPPLAGEGGEGEATNSERADLAPPRLPWLGPPPPNAGGELPFGPAP